MDFLAKQIAFLSEAFKILLKKLVESQCPSAQVRGVLDKFMEMLDHSAYDSLRLLQFSTQVIFEPRL
jgi:hypothetical protein